MDELTCGSGHDVQCFVFSIIGSRRRDHWSWIVADYDDLATSRIHLLIEDSAKGLG
jgi:hypothetical protein